MIGPTEVCPIHDEAGPRSTDRLAYFYYDFCYEDMMWF